MSRLQLTQSQDQLGTILNQEFYDDELMSDTELPGQNSTNRGPFNCACKFSLADTPRRDDNNFQTLINDHGSIENGMLGEFVNLYDSNIDPDADNTVPLSQINTVAAPTSNRIQTSNSDNFPGSASMNETRPETETIDNFGSIFGTNQPVQSSVYYNALQQPVQGEVSQPQGAFLPSNSEVPVQQNFEDLSGTVNGQPMFQGNNLVQYPQNPQPQYLQQVVQYEQQPVQYGQQQVQYGQQQVQYGQQQVQYNQQPVQYLQQPVQYVQPQQQVQYAQPQEQVQYAQSQQQVQYVQPQQQVQYVQPQQQVQNVQSQQISQNPPQNQGFAYISQPIFIPQQVQPQIPNTVGMGMNQVPTLVYIG